MTKICSKCKEEKPLSSFWKRKGTHRSWCINCCRASRKGHSSYNPEYRRAWHLASKYGMTHNDYEEMLRQQGGVCAICKTPPKSAHFHIDHDHNTNKVRGILCSKCNTMLGYARDNSHVLFNAVFYLLHHDSIISPSYMLAKAYVVASSAHEGHVRKDKTPYINHPLRVAAKVDSEVEKIVALLHDVVEDSRITLVDLKAFGFSKEVIDAVDALTKKPGEKYSDFILRAKANPIARVVKLADIADNLEDQSALEPEEAEFLANRYNKAIEVLNG